MVAPRALGRQCLAGARAIASALDLPDGAWQATFQSRFGGGKWLSPATDATVSWVAGVAAGAALSVPLASTLRALLYGVAPDDPATLVGVATLIAGAGWLASYLPARRGTRVDPVETLRAG